MIQTLLDGSDAARILTFNNVCDLFRKFQFSFFNDLFIFNDVDGDVVIDKAEDIQIKVFNRTLYFDDIFDTHFVALCIFDDGNGTVQFIQFQVMIDRHGFTGFDMVEYETFVKCSNI